MKKVPSQVDAESQMLGSIKLCSDIMDKATMQQKIDNWMERAGYSVCATWRDMPDEAISYLAKAMHKTWENNRLGDW